MDAGYPDRQNSGPAKVGRWPSGGAPSLGEPLAIEFANTHYAVRGRVREGIGTPDHLRAWLVESAAALGCDGAGLHVGADEVRAFLELRAAIRGLCQACLDDRPGDGEDIEALNAAAAGAPRWPRLDRTGSAYTVTEQTAGERMAIALAAIARDAIALVGGTLRGRLRACPAPGCVLYFVKDHPRREWCSAGCGNRARAARHYRRHRPHTA